MKKTATSKVGIVGIQSGASTMLHYSYHFTPDGHIVAQFHPKRDRIEALEFLYDLGFTKSQLLARVNKDEYNDDKLVIASSVLYDDLPNELRSRMAVSFQQERDSVPKEKDGLKESVQKTVTEIMTPTLVVTLGPDDSYSYNDDDVIPIKLKPTG